MRYTDLIFDLYGTLVDIHTEENEAVWEKTALYFGYYGIPYTAQQLKTDYESVLTERESVLGEAYEMYPDVPMDGVLARLFRQHGVTDQADALGLNAAQVFRIASTEYIRVYDYVPEALAELRQQGYRLWLLSNAQHAFTAYELRHLGLDKAFDGIFLSSDYECRKPDSRFFRALLDGQHLDPRRCLMIGNDRATDIAGAKAVGLDTLYLHTNLTPTAQSAACQLPEEQHHFEVEGADWRALVKYIPAL